MSEVKRKVKFGAVLTASALLNLPAAMAVPLDGGTLDPVTIPKYVTPLVIPPVMNNTGVADDYDIGMRQFKQQILPGGIWNTVNGRTDAFPPTPVWSYGPATDPVPNSKALGGKKSCQQSAFSSVKLDDLSGSYLLPCS